MGSWRGLDALVVGVAVGVIVSAILTGDLVSGGAALVVALLGQRRGWILIRIGVGR